MSNARAIVGYVEEILLSRQSASDAPLIVSVSGIRGVIGKSLTPGVVTDFAAAYGSRVAGETVVLSRDGRASGPMFRHAAIAGLLSVGCRVADVGISATPSCGYYVRATGAAGAIQITASHNPPEWNGLKLFRPEGFIVGPEVGQQIADAYQRGDIRYADHSGILQAELVPDPHRPHLNKVCSLIDVGAVRSRKFRVVLDANHASGAIFGPRLLESLGCEVEVLGSEPNGQFEHPPEPLAQNLTGLCDAVRDIGADVGFAVDPDADRLALVDDRGVYIGEEYTLALAIRHRVADEQGTVVINSSTSRVSEDAARKAGCNVLRTSVGEVHVAERMIAENAIIGGEGNGGVIDPRVGMGRDSAIGMALILDLLVKEGRPLSELMKELPAYVIRKEKFPVNRDRLAETLDRTADRFSDGMVDRSDGIRIDWEDAWVQLRASNTEPIVRVIAEAKSEDRARKLCEQVREIVETASN